MVANQVTGKHSEYVIRIIFHSKKIIFRKYLTLKFISTVQYKVSLVNMLHRIIADFSVSSIGFIVGAPDKTVIVAWILAFSCVRGGSGKG